MKKVWEDNREFMIEHQHKIAQMGGKASNSQSLKRLWENDREGMLKISSEAGKKVWRENREKMMEYAYKNIGLTKAWENNREKMLEGCRKGGNNVWIKGNRETIIEGCRMGGRNTWVKNREKLTELSKENGKIGGKIGGPITVKKFQKLNPSPIEKIVRDFLDKKKIKHEDNIWFGRKEADIMIPKYKLIIECDGFTHNFPDRKINDRYKTKLFNRLGYKVLRLKSAEIYHRSFQNKLLKKINKLKLELHSK